jgi:hypothetical protein
MHRPPSGTKRLPWRGRRAAATLVLLASLLVLAACGTGPTATYDVRGTYDVTERVTYVDAIPGIEVDDLLEFTVDVEVEGGVVLVNGNVWSRSGNTLRYSPSPDGDCTTSYRVTWTSDDRAEGRATSTCEATGGRMETAVTFLRAGG